VTFANISKCDAQQKVVVECSGSDKHRIEMAPRASKAPGVSVEGRTSVKYLEIERKSRKGKKPCFDGTCTWNADLDGLGTQ
jgi:hypothetical protein